MPLIDVSRARSGMVLTADVRDRRGRVLIPQGKELMERYLEALPMWGITHVEVEGETEEVSTPDLDDALLARADRDVAERFRHANRGHPAIEALFAVCVRRRAEHLLREGGAR